MKSYYLTTPIYYVNAAPHIGHTYTTMVADTVARWKRMQGYDVVLTTGTDEHGQKIERAAKAVNKTEQEFTDIIAEEFRMAWDKLSIRIDRFMRTTDPRHEKKVQELFLRCKERGYVYKGEYTGQYCVSCELYVNDAKPGDPCPDCGRSTETVTEENYYFKLSAFQDRLLELYEKQPDFIQPESRRNEVISFVKGGLSDLSISRTTIKWGIPVPGEEKHVFYVWFDALTTYMSAVEGEGRWPADLHLIGKEIVRFHAIYWPAFLWAADWPLPKRVFAHGFLLFDNDKMSKSKGNLVRPLPILEVIGQEPLRYFLLREIVFGQDGNFSYDAVITRYNADLANGLGNLVSRTLSMIRQYRNGQIPASQGSPEIAEVAQTVVGTYRDAMESFQFSKGLEALWQLLSLLDRSIVQYAPWKLIKDTSAEAQQKLDTILYSSAEVIRLATALLGPVIPQACAKIWAQLGMAEPLESVQLGSLAWGQLPAGQAVGEATPVFPRIEAAPAVARMFELEEKEKARQDELVGKAPKVETPKYDIAPIAETISIDDFVKVDLRVGIVRSAEPVKGSDKLLHLKVDIGEAQPRTIVAGIATAYKPEQMLNRKVVIVANLQPRKLRGVESQGMIVAASLEGGSPVLAGFLEDVPVGARLK
ncbi:MAG: methionine--tRNA ligase [Bryobacterales bacterium]|nr:methionine--tRNA ligase [Bryobacterales bacterium]